MPSLTRQVKTAGKSLLHGLFALGQRLGVDVLPRHFYSQIPDLARLKGQTGWRAPMSLHGVQGRELEGQIAFVGECVTPERTALFAARDVHAEAVAANGSDGGYGPIEAQFLYAFIQAKAPRRVIQVGCGVSTAVIEAAAKDAGGAVDILCIDPYPTDFLRRRQAAGGIRLLAEPAQSVDLATFETLEAGDLLFIDSTHAVTAGSEVNRLVLEVLPRLKPGVFVHFHDIYFPYDYPRRLLSEDLFFHAESTLVHAFLAGNPGYRIEASLSMLHYGAKEAMRGWFTRYDPQGDADGLAAPGGRHFPSALWLRTVSARP
ncbi:putative O-methyltransferase YrrM [Caulobacter ginsengisoli]|uniref:O-methyltransferase YrrM n=1 Tax=Caulobacter ginsengisoli TaxID=400775 RepID=A0ABU0IQ30_9CAUL|nr:class I SAM-dependent methyltransferase [Caulobacter ginsengisoli]MDQ0463124.1 putative O-methyltransferase YrrM [Caulobacter ginsengisoli]